MKERLTNNLGLKFIAVFFTIVLWLVVMNVEDPIDTRTFKGISVGIRNDDCLLYTSPSPRDRQKSRMPSSA